VALLRSLAAASLASLVTFAAAQTGRPPLDLSIPRVTEGMVTAIREVSTAKAAPAPVPGGQSPGAPTELEQSPPVGAVVYFPFGGAPSDKGMRFGAAGTPEMQARLAQSAYEVVVKMEDGEIRTFRPREPGRFSVGQRVTVRSGELEPAPKDGI
jgi:hypothetical protein